MTLNANNISAILSVMSNENTPRIIDTLLNACLGIIFADLDHDHPEVEDAIKFLGVLKNAAAK